MRRDAIIGVDIGTSYIKVCGFDMAGGVVIIKSRISINFEINDGIDSGFASKTYMAVHGMVCSVIEGAYFMGYTVRSMAICAISPVIVAFSIDNLDRTLSIPYWCVPIIDRGTTGKDRAIRRFEVISQKAKCLGIKNTVFSDIIGYINYRLTGNLTINTVTLSELGVNKDDISQLYDNILLSPSEACNKNKTVALAGNAISCCAGAPDSFCAAIGVGAISPGSLMIYLGTFGSLLHIKNNLLDSCLHYQPDLPYEWIFSTPYFGKSIEDFARKISDVNGPENLSILDSMAEKVEPGSHGLFLHLPRLYPDTGVVVGKYGFKSGSKKYYHKSVYARAVLEALPLTLLAHDLVYPNPHSEIYVNGGGARSKIWVKIISDCLNTKAIITPGASTALGSAKVACAAIAGLESTGNFPACEKNIINPNPHSHTKFIGSASSGFQWYSTI